MPESSISPTRCPCRDFAETVGRVLFSAPGHVADVARAVAVLRLHVAIEVAKSGELLGANWAFQVGTRNGALFRLRIALCVRACFAADFPAPAALPSRRCEHCADGGFAHSP
ncbi:hypothetical protein NFJ02_43g111000 [Pycnococcus provasolii]